MSFCLILSFYSCMTHLAQKINFNLGNFIVSFTKLIFVINFYFYSHSFYLHKLICFSYWSMIFMSEFNGLIPTIINFKMDAGIVYLCTNNIKLHNCKPSNILKTIHPFIKIIFLTLSRNFSFSIKLSTNFYF